MLRYKVMNSQAAVVARATPRVHRVEITDHWSIDLDSDFFRRVDDGDLVLWKPGRTVYAAVYWTDVATAEGYFCAVASITSGLMTARTTRFAAAASPAFAASYMRLRPESGSVSPGRKAAA